MSEGLTDYKTLICDVKCFCCLTLITKLIFPINELCWDLLTCSQVEMSNNNMMSDCLHLCLSQVPVQTVSVVSPDHSKTPYY